MNIQFEEVQEKTNEQLYDLSHSLIGSSHTVNTTPRVRGEKKSEQTGSLYSIDMVRYRLRSNPKLINEITGLLDTHMCAGELSTYTQGRRIGGYRLLWTWRYDLADETEKAHDYTSVACGYGLVKGNMSIDEGTGFLEFNPNKLGTEGRALLGMLDNAGVRAELVRYDLAIDYPMQRDYLRMIKDGRKYSVEVSDSVTEYLGQRNKPGRVKLYDKSTESKLAAPWTRIELTCDADWNVKQIISQLPQVYDCSLAVSKHNLRGITYAFALALQALCLKQEAAETWLHLVNAKTRAKIRKAYAEHQAIEYDKNCITELLHDLKTIPREA